MKISPRKDIKKYLEITKAEHDGNGFDELVDALKKGYDKGVIGKMFGDTTRQTVWNWLGDIKTQYQDIYEEIMAVSK